ncbi:hypothetical protein [Thermopirellula anaerolimosa]
MTVALRKQNSRSHAERFPAEEFTRIPGVIVFAEHSTTLRDGTPVTYDRDALEKIARNCNRRIEETGNYAAVCLGHIYESVSAKPLIGFAGPFRVEDQGGRAVIAADFWIFKDDAKQLKRYPRPSPEVWIPLDGFDPDRIFLDPIAMLGAETPRLDLGMNFLYRAEGNGMLCEKYAAQPSAWNMSPADPPPETYTGDPQMAQLTPEDIQAILHAIEATDWFKWIQEQRAAANKPEPDAKGEPSDDKGPPPPIDKKRRTYADDDKADAGRAPAPPDDDEAQNDDDNKPADDGTSQRPKRVEEYRSTTLYARREALLEAQKEIYQLRQGLERERALRVNSERRSILQSLAQQFDLDVDEEMRRVAYGKASDQEFTQHVETIRRRYRPLPTAMDLPVWGDAAPDYAPDGPERYARKQREELSRKALEYAKQKIKAGQHISYDEALEAVSRGR